MVKMCNFQDLKKYEIGHECAMTMGNGIYFHFWNVEVYKIACHDVVWEKNWPNGCRTSSALFHYLLQIEQKIVAMMLISSTDSQRILTKSGMDNLLGSESNLAKSNVKIPNGCHGNEKNIPEAYISGWWSWILVCEAESIISICLPKWAKSTMRFWR